MSELVLVLDFGGQYKELIARTVRELSVYSEIKPGCLTANEIKQLNPIGIILTGGPDSVYLPDSPKCDPDIYRLGIPILGICYGMQMMCHMLGGEVTSGVLGEYGRFTVTPVAWASRLPAGNRPAPVPSALFGGVDAPFPALMSHRDIVSRLPEGFHATASTDACPVAACENPAKKLYGTQFHPEAAHTDGGYEIVRCFLYDICRVSGDYKLDNYIDTQIAMIRRRVGDKQVLLALSGGVDSSVAAALLSKAIPDQLICIFVDHGFMRLNEGDEIESIFTKRKLRFIRVNSAERFLAKLKGVTDPEAKRKIIGEEFIRVFEEESTKLSVHLPSANAAPPLRPDFFPVHGDIPFLAQGTIYPDIVESGGKHGATIKSHHNVGGLPESLSFSDVIEPLAGLFKDEVRILGKKLGLPAALVNRQPFPGPGLAIRVMGEVTDVKLETLRQTDAILRDEVSKLRRKPQQYFAVLTDTRSVGVKGDDRTYDPVVAIRAVTTSDFMTCEYAEIPHKVLRRISSRITSEIPSVSRVVYDITSKPPATVEWE